MTSRRDIAWIGVWAMATLAGLAVLRGPTQSVATERFELAVLPQPALAIDGASVRLETISDAPLEAGKPARVRLTASNPSPAQVTARVHVSLTATEPASPMLRVMPFPRSFHECTQTLIVQGGQTMSVEITSDQSVPVGTISAVVRLADGAAQAAGGGVRFPLATRDSASQPVAQVE